MKKGFTLIELLVVIAILAVLAAVVVLVLNPAELLRQGRDSARISDLSSLNSAISLYMADVTAPDLGTCSGSAGRVTAGTPTTPFAVRSSTGTIVYDLYGVNSTAGCSAAPCGWVDINFTSISTGSPLSREPRDPVNSVTSPSNHFYAYACDETATSGPYYEINANMESGKYKHGGPSDVESKDGGDNDNWYETGNNLTL